MFIIARSGIVFAGTMTAARMLAADIRDKQPEWRCSAELKIMDMSPGSSPFNQHFPSEDSKDEIWIVGLARFKRKACGQWWRDLRFDPNLRHFLLLTCDMSNRNLRFLRQAKNMLVMRVHDVYPKQLAQRWLACHERIERMITHVSEPKATV